MANVLAISRTWSKSMTPLQSPLPAALSGNLPVFFDQISAAPGPSIAADVPESLRQTVILEPKAYARICLTQRRESLPDTWVRNSSDSDWSRRVGWATGRLFALHMLGAGAWAALEAVGPSAFGSGAVASGYIKATAAGLMVTYASCIKSFYQCLDPDGHASRVLHKPTAPRDRAGLVDPEMLCLNGAFPITEGNNEWCSATERKDLFAALQAFGCLGPVNKDLVCQRLVSIERLDDAIQIAFLASKPSLRHQEVSANSFENIAAACRAEARLKKLALVKAILTVVFCEQTARHNLLPQADLLQAEANSLALIYAANGGFELHDAIVELQVQAAHKRGMARALRQLLPPHPDSDAGGDTGTAAATPKKEGSVDAVRQQAALSLRKSRRLHQESSRTGAEKPDRLRATVPAAVPEDNRLRWLYSRG
jgi:hypothetical protein